MSLLVCFFVIGKIDVAADPSVVRLAKRLPASSASSVSRRSRWVGLNRFLPKSA
ncbi:MAG: hypothetical protein CM1200mP34_3330 [Verrucomicrobiales bacterium]|nr:MAG: hypothetical protein CM1200mP34_3330 [Verrucomicrobiales bacterium]